VRATAHGGHVDGGTLSPPGPSHTQAQPHCHSPSHPYMPPARREIFACGAESPRRRFALPTPLESRCVTFRSPMASPQLNAMGRDAHPHPARALLANCVAGNGTPATLPSPASPIGAHNALKHLVRHRSLIRERRLRNQLVNLALSQLDTESSERLRHLLWRNLAIAVAVE